MIFLGQSQRFSLLLQGLKLFLNVFLLLLETLVFFLNPKFYFDFLLQLKLSRLVLLPLLKFSLARFL